MRPLAILSLLLVMLAGAAVLPTASAAPPQPACNGIWAVRETVGPVTVFASPPCYDISVRTMSCPLSQDKWTEVRSGTIAIKIQTCDKVSTETSSTMAPPPPPPMRCNPIYTVGPISQVVSVTLTSSCRVIVEVLPIVACGTDPIDGRKVITQGSITVILPCGQIDSCEPPVECYPMSSAAIEPPVCGPDQMCTEPELGICDYDDMCNDAGCPYPLGAEQGTNVAGLHLDCGPQDLCSGPMRCTSPLEMGAVAIPPVCIHPHVEQGPVRAGVDQCRQNHETYPSCSSAQRIHQYQQVALVWAQVDVCLPHSPPPAASDVGLVDGLALTASNPGPCGSAIDPRQRCPAPYPIRPCENLPIAVASALPTSVTYTVSDRCEVDLFVKADVMDCLWGEGYHETATAGPVTLWTWGCNQPYPPVESTAAAAPPCTCPPPQPLCYSVNRAIAWGDELRVDDSCNATVTLHAYCGLQGTDYHQVRASKLTVNYETCQQPPVE